MTSESSLPEARVITANKSASQRWSTRLWWLTAASAILAIALVASSFRTQGLEIHVRFQDGHGLKAGDTLHYRGIDVGTVTRVVVSSQMDGVDTSILLAPVTKASP